MFSFVPRFAFALSLAMILESSASGQVVSECGEPPLVADTSFKGQIEGKAKFLSSIIGDANVSGQIESARTDVYKQAPNGLAASGDRYLLYTTCLLLMKDTTTTTTDKISLLIKVRASFQTPVKY